ncbi:MAG: helix-turn-helix transcriptional regulator [Lachnospiraceae bacterium]|nr:helix-turn-helix transcriptional regulator [Lachnospiraceae bacterium]
MKTIGENIKIMRRKCGFTQEELASRLAVTPQAISKWENGNGTPDISQLVPLAQIFGITTDSLLGVVSATYGTAHTEAALGHEKLLMSTAQSDAEKHLAAYTYFRAESEKEPTNYTIMRKCINHAAEISRHADFSGFLSDKPEMLQEIFADCERKNLCISRYCEDKSEIEKSDYAMIWIYIHIKEFDKAKVLIDRLPSLESNNLKEHIMTQFIHFQYGFEREKECIADNMHKLLCASGKEFFFSFEDYAYFADSKEAVTYCSKLLGILNAYKAFDSLLATALTYENMLRGYLPKCYAKHDELDSAAAELVTIAENYATLATINEKYQDVEDAKADARKAIEKAIDRIDKKNREKVIANANYKKAMEIIEKIR